MAPGRKSIKTTLLLPTLVYVLAIGILVALLLGFQLANFTSQQQNQLGHALGTQLAEMAQLPLARGDTISLQVILDKLAASVPQVAHASALDLNDRIIAQSRKKVATTVDTVAFRQPVILEKKVSGSIQVDLVDQTVSPTVRTPVMVALALWFISGFFLLFRQHRSVSRLAGRLSSLSQGLPSSPQEERVMDEISLLEARVAPLVTRAAESDENNGLKFSCMVAVCCHNLPRLKVQLSAEHFEALFGQLDAVIDQACMLYEGKRLSASRNCLLIEFSSASSTGDHSLRALYFARASLMICQEWAPSRGIPLELSMVLDEIDVPETESTWIREQAVEQTINAIADVTEISVPWEILLRQRLFNNETFGSCVEAEPVSVHHPMSRFKRLAEPQSSLLMRQVAFLQTRISLDF